MMTNDSGDDELRAQSARCRPARARIKWDDIYSPLCFSLALSMWPLSLCCCIVRYFVILLRSAPAAFPTIPHFASCRPTLPIGNNFIDSSLCSSTSYVEGIVLRREATAVVLQKQRSIYLHVYLKLQCEQISYHRLFGIGLFVI